MTMRIVALGGTGFLSSAVVDAVRAAGHDIVVVSRGTQGVSGGVHGASQGTSGASRGTHGAPPDGVRWVRADRDDADALAGAVADLQPDAVIDSCGYTVAGAHAAARAFAGVPRYAYVSSISAYRSWPPGPVRSEDDDVFSPEDDLEDYGPMKAESERVLGAAFPSGFLAARAGLIVGPRDVARRLTLWLHRIAMHERVAVPETLDQEIAVVDARDLAAWLVLAVESGLSGPFNVTGLQEMTTLGGLLELCRDVVRGAGGVPAELVPVPESELLAAEVQPWVDLPFWLPSDIAPTAWQVDVTRAHEAGLTHRPLAESVADTWAWQRDADLEHPPLPESLERLAR